jgi:hypothetical protein
MKSIAILMLTLLTSSSCLQDVFNELQQLNGTWKMQTPKGPIFESWKKTGENQMQGGSYKINGKDTIHFEIVKLSQLPDGIFYIPVVKDQNDGIAVAFKMISSANNNFVFENKEHDFPQRIIYHLVSKDSIHAWTEGIKDGKPGRSDYYYTRIQ